MRTCVLIKYKINGDDWNGFNSNYRIIPKK